MVRSLSILSIGAGAISTYIGGILANFGHRVVFCLRPEHRKQIRDRGLKIYTKSHVYAISDPLIVDSIEDAVDEGPIDFVLFALKTYDTDSFLDSILPFSQNLPPFLCLSNGVENETKLAIVLGRERVIPGTVTSAVSRHKLGEVRLERLRGVGVAKGYPLSTDIMEAMDQAGLNARLIANADNMKWSKLLSNLIGSASAAILEMPPAEIYDHPILYWMEHQQLLETLSVMRAQNINVINLPGIPVKMLAFAIRFLPRKFSQLILKRAVAGGRGKKMPSLYLDLLRGRKVTEVEYLQGAVVRAGQKHGLPTPVNEFLTQTLLSLTSGDIKWNTYQGQPNRLIEDFKKNIATAIQIFS